MGHPPGCFGYAYHDPILGGVEITAKLGPEVQAGPVKAGFSFYKNLSTGQTGGKAEINAGIFNFEVNNPTPEGGSLGGGGPENNQWSAGFIGFEKNFTTGESGFEPSKAFTFGAQAVVGFELTWSLKRAEEIATKNVICGVDD